MKVEERLANLTADLVAYEENCVFLERLFSLKAGVWPAPSRASKFHTLQRVETPGRAPGLGALEGLLPRPLPIANGLLPEASLGIRAAGHIQRKDALQQQAVQRA